MVENKNKQVRVSKVPVNKPKMKSPIQMFFDLGDKVTGGDPVKVMDFQYYMLTILFLAFLSMFCLNTYRFIISLDASYLIWALVGFAITSLQYFNLKNMYQMRKARREMPKVKPEEENKIENVEDMLGSFKKNENK